MSSQLGWIAGSDEHRTRRLQVHARLYHERERQDNSRHCDVLVIVGWAVVLALAFLSQDKKTRNSGGSRRDTTLCLERMTLG